MSEIKNWEIEMIDTFWSDLKKQANTGLQNPLFAKQESQDFFADLQPKNSIFSKPSHKENTWLSLIKPTFKQQVIYEQLKRRNASKEELEHFFKYYNKTDNEILENQDYKETIDYFRGILNKNDLDTLKNFLIMTYRNNFGYWIINQW